MHEPTRLFDAAAGLEAIGKDDSADRRCESDDKSRTEAEQQGGVKQTREKRQDIEQGQDEKQTEHGERRPAGGPDPLPQQHGTGEAQLRQERGVGVRCGVGHAAPRFRASSELTSESQAGMESRESISS